MADCSITKEREGERVLYRLAGVFDRAAAWALREKVDREAGREVLLDFSLVRDFSDLGVAVLAHGLTNASRRVLFRGLRQHQLRIFRYCGVPIEEMTAREAAASPLDASAAAPTTTEAAHDRAHHHPA
jgi:anti-anti-sigma regulatory factor